MQDQPRPTAPTSAPVVGSVAAAARIMRLLATEPAPLGVNAIARRLGLSPSSCFNILKTLVAWDFAEIDDRTKTYSLGVAPVYLARRMLKADQVMQFATPHLQQMADDYRCVSTLWRLTRTDRLVLIGLFDSRAVMNIHIEVGQRLPAMTGAMGRCIAANRRYDVEQLRATFDQLPWQSPPSFEEYVADVALAGRNGWAVDVNNFVQGVTTIAAPVPDQSGATRYCISNILFSAQPELRSIEDIGRRLSRVAAEVAVAL